MKKGIILSDREIDYLVNKVSKCLQHFKRASLEKQRKEFLTDPDKQRRIEMGLCIECYYSPIMVGQAFTEYNCETCKKKFMWHNTGVPRHCSHCATDKDICIRCGEEDWKQGIYNG